MSVPRPDDDYARDFYGWTRRQAELLRDGRIAEADLVNIAEEIDSMGRAEKRELASRLTVLLLHLLKWRHQPGLRGNSWRLTIAEQRARIVEHLADNPSLRPLLDDAIASAYRYARLAAQRETGLDEATFPPACPYEVAEAMDETFLPGGGG